MIVFCPACGQHLEVEPAVTAVTRGLGFSSHKWQIDFKSIIIEHVCEEQ